MLSNNFFVKKTFNRFVLALLATTVSSPFAMSMQNDDNYSHAPISKKSNSQKPVSFYEKLIESGKHKHVLKQLKQKYKKGKLDLDVTFFYADMLADEDDLQEAISVFKKLAEQDIPYAIQRLEELEEEDLERVLEEKEKKVQKTIWEE